MQLGTAHRMSHAAEFVVRLYINGGYNFDPTSIRLPYDAIRPRFGVARRSNRSRTVVESKANPNRNIVVTTA